MVRVARHTWDYITSVHGVLVLDEAEAIHELNLSDLASAMGVEVVLNIGLGSCSMRSSQRARFGALNQKAGGTVGAESDSEQAARRLLTEANEVHESTIGHSSTNAGIPGPPGKT